MSKKERMEGKLNELWTKWDDVDIDDIPEEELEKIGEELENLMGQIGYGTKSIFVHTQMEKYSDFKRILDTQQPQWNRRGTVSRKAKTKREISVLMTASFFSTHLKTKSTHRVLFQLLFQFKKYYLKTLKILKKYDIIKSCHNKRKRNLSVKLGAREIFIFWRDL